MDEWAVIIMVAVGALIVLAVGTILWTATRQLPTHAPPDIPVAEQGQQIAVVVNPSKDGADALVDAIQDRCGEKGLPPPLILETTIEEPGTSQAQEAILSGADLVVAAGGDGTVRAVATGMVNEGVPMGIIPMGTGNLFARNLDLPVNSVTEAVDVIFEGRERWVDVGWMKVVDAEAADAYFEDEVENAIVGDKQLFLVIAGLGFDAKMVADTDAALKRRVGWLAYFVAALKHLHGPRIKATITIDDHIPVDAKLRTVMVGNCGLLPGGLTLIPDAKIDDGLLDVAAIDTRVGLAGWMQLLGEVVMLGANEKPNPANNAAIESERADKSKKIGQIDMAQARRVAISVEEPQLAQVDGDSIGHVLEVEVWIDPGSLVVRAV